jgi:hypothetical protein
VGSAPELQDRLRPLSADDGGIEQALEALERRLQAWLSALTIACPQPEPAPGPPPERVALAAPPAGAREHTPAAAEVQCPPPPPEPPRPARAPEVCETTTGEDEALLAELEPEIANAVRVKRRLTVTRRDIRDLIAEVEAARRGRSREPEKEPQRKAWWRKRDE